MSRCDDTTDALPDVHEALLSPASLNLLFDEWRDLARVTEVIGKSNAKGYCEPRNLPIETARAMWASGELKALQVRYFFDGTEWFDTLMRVAEGESTRLVRMGGSASL